MIVPELAIFEVMAKDILRRVLAEDDPEDIRKWIGEQLARLGGGDASALMTWAQSFDYSDMMLVEFERIANDPSERDKLLTFPWSSWRKHINYLDPGTLTVITAPDGQGKTIYAESISEHWAKKGIKVAFVHYELNRKLMMLRRLARHTGLQSNYLKEGKYTKENTELIRERQDGLRTWQGEISYLHTPGWTMEKTTAELRKLNSEGLCDVVVLDYLEKAAASRRQLQMYGANGNMREADNVEQLKIFSESTEIPVIMVAQMNKDSKSKSFDNIDRTGIRGAGEKTEKANAVIMIKRERIEEGYSNIVDVLVDKNTMGPLGTFRQVMQPEFFRVSDPATT